MSQWIKTLILALEIPFDSEEGKIWSKIVSNHPKYTDLFLTSLSTVDIIKFPYIGFSLQKWFINETKNEENLYLNNYIGVMIKIEKFSNKSKIQSNNYPIFQQTSEFLNNLIIEIKELKDQVKEEDQEEF